MLSRLRAMKAATALAMPAPPITKAEIETKVIKVESLLTNSSVPCAALSAPRMRQPASGNFTLASSITALAEASDACGSLMR